MNNEMNKWYERLTQKEISKLKDGLENRMMLKDQGEKEAIWNGLLQEKYSEYLRELERNQEKEEQKKEARKEILSQYQRDLSMGIATLNLYTSGKYKAWVAEIVGTDEKYGLARNFINPFDVSGNTKTYHLKEGKIYNYLSDNEQYFAKVVNSKLVEISKLELVASLQNN